MFLQPYLNGQDVFTSHDIDKEKLDTISSYKNVFLQKKYDPGIYKILEPEVAESWQRCKKYHVDPQMQELRHVRKNREMNALLKDKKDLINLTKSYFYTLFPLLNMPIAITIFDKSGTLLELVDNYQLLRLNPRSGSIWREDTVGTSSTSLSIESGKIVQLAGSQHFCKALEHQLATTLPVVDTHGDTFGLITIINHVNDALKDKETFKKVLLWANTLRYVVETQMEFRKKNYVMNTKPEVREQFFLANHSDKNLPDSQNKLKDYFSDILGESPQIERIRHIATRFAQTNNSVLIIGESGTGKEMFAQAIHKVSGRSGPIVTINCAALPVNLIASELFGYVGGAFTGADAKGRKGKIELANNGTLFLDEIGDMPLEIQSTFLRVLEEKKIMRLGDNKEIPVDFRLVAATNCDLFKLVQEKKFRADLYYRLKVLELNLPPLRERGKDILLLAEYFLELTCKESGIPALKLSKEAEDFILGYSWPGNIRQLKNTIVYAANICEGKVIKLRDFPSSLLSDIDLSYQPEKIPKTEQISPIQETEEETIRKALSLTGNNVRIAAKMVGLSKTTVYRKIKQYNIVI